MRRLLIASAVLGLSSGVSAQNITTYIDANRAKQTVDPDHPLPVGAQGSVADGASSTGVKPTLVAGVDASGNVQSVATDSAGVLAFPKAGSADRVITKTSVSATTSTTVCPAATNPVSTEIQVQTGSIGLGLNGQTLSSASYGTATTNPDIFISAGNAVYTPPVAPTNAVTAYTATAQIVVCIPTLRQ